MEQAKISSAQGTPPAPPAQPPAPQADDGAPATGFAALLAALDALTDGNATTRRAGAPGSPTDAAAATDGGDAWAPATWPGLAGTDGVDSAAGSADAGAGGMPSPDGSELAALTALATLAAWAGVGPAQGLVAETARLDAGADLQGAPPPGLGAGAGRSGARLQNAQARRAAGGMGAADAMPGWWVAGNATGNSGPRLTAAQTAGLGTGLGAGPQSAGAMAAPGAGAPAASDAPASNALAGTLAAPAVAGAGPQGPAHAPLAEAVSAALAPASGQGSGQALGQGPGIPAGGGAWPEGQSAPAPDQGANAVVVRDAHPDAFPDLRGAQQLGAQQLLAHQLAYRVHPGNQSAQLTLQREGQALEVSVSLSGNRAHVAFGSDQPQTRELLDQGQAQLSDLLSSEGLVLSGMSVGMSAGGNAQAQAESPQPQGSARSAQVLALAPIDRAAQGRAGGASGHALDIFV